ncbi:MAG: hypothetical protein RR425_03850, partial [Erysipelotrichales bacterium]
EIALPRLERKVGLNYLDYELYFDDGISLKEASKRRDLSINALMYDFKNDKIIDYYNGLEDLKNSTLKAVDYDSFEGDATRLLRLIELKFRLNFDIDYKTWQLKDRMDIHILEQPSLVVAQYFNKIIIADNFDIELFLEGFYNLFEVDRYKNYISKSQYHPEKSLYNHLVGVIKCLQLLKVDNKRDFKILFWALFFHDYGKLACLGDHELYSIELYETFKDHLITKSKHQDLVRELIRDHMVIREYAQKEDTLNMKRLMNKYKNQFYLLEIVGKCDYGGRVLDYNHDEYYKRMSWFENNILNKYKELR